MLARILPLVASICLLLPKLQAQDPAPTPSSQEIQNPITKPADVPFKDKPVRDRYVIAMQHARTSGCISMIPELEQANPSEAPALEFQLAMQMADGGTTETLAAKEIFRKYLSDGPFKNKPQAKRARLQYGRLSALHGDENAARTTLQAMGEDAASANAFLAFRYLDEAGLIQTPEDIQNWITKLDTAHKSSPTQLADKHAQVLAMLKKRNNGEHPFFKAYRECMLLEYNRDSIFQQKHYDQVTTPSALVQKWQGGMAISGA